MNKIICLSSVDYDWMFQRPQQLMRELARQGKEVIYCNKSQRNDRVLEFREPNLAICHNLEGLVNIGVTAAVVWVVDPQYSKYKGCFKENLFIYDCVDDFPYLILHHHRMLKAADVIVTTSVPLYRGIQRYRREVHLIPNGCDYYFFNEMENHEQDKKYNQRKIIGYIGAIAPWLDMELIAAAATRYQDHTFVIIGARLGGSVLPEGENIQYLGHQLYETIPTHLQNMDVVLIPFKNNQTTRATNPVKLYEYLAQGKPIVSVALPEIVPFRQYLYLSKTREEFLENLQLALKENNPRLIQERKSIAKENSWQERVRQIEEIIRQYLE